eukprot:88090-Pleurochrysis_carterae.AAC.1
MRERGSREKMRERSARSKGRRDDIMCSSKKVRMQATNVWQTLRKVTTHTKLRLRALKADRECTRDLEQRIVECTPEQCVSAMCLSNVSQQ